MIDALRPVQVAYHVADPVASAERLAREFGWGPFFLLEHVPLEWSRHRGVEREFDHSSAYGQAGDLMVELITQHNDAPSCLRDLFAPDQTGVHHVACFVENLEGSLQAFTARGVAIALDALSTAGVRFAMVDVTADVGHMLELYEPVEGLRRFYDHVRRSADGWNGDRPVRRLRNG